MELVVSIIICGLVISFFFGMINGTLPSRQSCTSQGGKWTEGIQYGEITQFCTYN